MTHDLNYCRPPSRGISPARVIVLVSATLALIPAHLYYTHRVAYFLWELSGGIRQYGLWTRYGTSDWGWSNPINVPTGVLCAAGLGPLAMLFLFLGSFVAAFSLADAAVRLPWRDRTRWGRWCWRLGLLAACWGWIPLPAKFTWLYYWSAAY